MKTYVVYKVESDHNRAVVEFLDAFARQTGRTLEAIDPESREGADFCRVYDIVEYPTVIAVDDSGVMQRVWRGVPLPTVAEVSYYA